MWMLFLLLLVVLGKPDRRQLDDARLLLEDRDVAHAAVHPVRAGHPRLELGRRWRLRRHGQRAFRRRRAPRRNILVPEPLPRHRTPKPRAGHRLCRAKQGLRRRVQVIPDLLRHCPGRRRGAQHRDCRPRRRKYAARGRLGGRDTVPTARCCCCLDLRDRTRTSLGTGRDLHNLAGAPESVADGAGASEAIAERALAVALSFGLDFGHVDALFHLGLDLGLER
mmetsp:Transcript_56770/g.132989  ORF Transcript_56770/g.132989 Transcript_56770/m.132989 type:complete len:223 (-) Transcript_56770:6459-7127(-)